MEISPGDVEVMSDTLFDTLDDNGDGILEQEELVDNLEKFPALRDNLSLRYNFPFLRNNCSLGYKFLVHRENPSLKY